MVFSVVSLELGASRDRFTDTDILSDVSAGRADVEGAKEELNKVL